MSLPWRRRLSGLLAYSKQRDVVGSALPLRLPVRAHQPHEKSLIHTDPLLRCPADAAATAKTSVAAWQHDHSCFRQEQVGTVELSASQSTSNETRWQAGPESKFSRLKIHTAPFMSRSYLNVWKMLNQYCFSPAGCVWSHCLILAEL